MSCLVQEGYHRFEKDKLEQENNELKRQVLELLAHRDDRSNCVFLSNKTASLAVGIPTWHKN